ncbi:carboxymuconolactone decarboxylase family protein [Thermincola potens]|uniref:Carboxymuconolactone decarboxylase n=1 Tax=Thermincola potens (strain JR) TaxID=635013 RepID=D5XB16_THEPJ|nr:carboxymuconolactone decarboxylase family protein [Thermincola potens]ADG81336.1 Carboxymuconolactone decarboxylase [Thermincola potens JR]
MQNNLSIEELLKKFESESGGDPKPMRLLAKFAPEGVFEHARNMNFVMSREAIPPKYKILMNIAIAAALGAKRCIETYVRMAKHKGLSNEEIVEALLVARFVKSATVISDSVDALELLDSQA